MKALNFAALLAVTASSALPSLAWSAQLPAAVYEDSRVRYVSYDPNNVVEVTGVMRSVVEIVFSDAERVSYVGVGDSVAWEVEPVSNILFLKPLAQNPPTNMVVVTTRPDGTLRSYNIDLQIRPGADTRIATGTPGVMFQVVYTYPGDIAAKEAQEQAKAAATQQKTLLDNVLANSGTGGPINWEYTAQGSSLLAPSSIYDNGQTTTLTFPLNESIPSIFGVLPDGQEGVVDYSVSGNQVTVHGVYPELRLRRGDANTTLIDRHYTNLGWNPATGTTSEYVTRQITAPPAGTTAAPAAPAAPLDLGN